MSTKTRSNVGYWEDNFFHDLFNFPYEFRHSDLMKTDVFESDTDYILNIDLPGYNKEDISITLEDGYLLVEAKKETKVDEKDKNGRYLRRERYMGNCSRSYYIGEIDEKSIKANFDKGVLTLSYPKEEIQKIEAKKHISIE